MSNAPNWCHWRLAPATPDAVRLIENKQLVGDLDQAVAKLRARVVASERFGQLVDEALGAVGKALEEASKL